MINFHSNKKDFFDTLCLPFWKDDASLEAFDSHFITDEVKAVLESGDFKGESQQLVVLYPSNKKPLRLILLGLGSLKNKTSESLRRQASSLIKFCKEKKIESITLVGSKTLTDEDQKSFIEGLLLSNYAFDINKKDKTTLLKKIGLINFDKSFESAFKEIEIVVEGVFLARDLTSGNADDVTPKYLAQVAKNIANDFKKTISVKILGPKEIKKEGLGLLEAVSRGSTNDPALIIAQYRGNKKSDEHLVLIGKGLTYDTGGLFIKPRGSMDDMRCDMAGASVCLATLLTVAKLKLEVNLSIVVAAAENSIGPDAFKPGDVYKSYQGKTVEIQDTDAEGRLVLADAITYAIKHLAPTSIIDFATLTGAIMVALGDEVAGFFSNDEKLSASLIKASENTHEKLWRMPLHEDYKSQLKSDVADIKNKADRWGGAIFAALFLEDFVEKTPWAHLDIAGTAFYSKDKYYTPKNGTGFGVRLLIDYLKENCHAAKRAKKK
jgi:leucyl aminopeptidase